MNLIALYQDQMLFQMTLYELLMNYKLVGNSSLRKPEKQLTALVVNRRV